MSLLAALGWFIARFIDKLRHFFTTLHGAQTFSWTKECKSVFDAINQYLIEPPTLSNLEEGKELYMYLVVPDYAVSVVLFRQTSKDGQKPVYYVSKALMDVETRYSQIEQTTLALHIVAKKLRPYF